MSSKGDRVSWRESADREFLRMMYTMGLYVCVILLAELSVTHPTNSETSVMELVWGTSMGLVAGHWFAFTWAGRLVEGGSSGARGRRITIAQFIGAFAVALPVSIAVLAVPVAAERTAARIVAACLIGTLVYADTRWSGASRGRSILLTAGALAAGFVVVVLKTHLL